MDTGDLSEKPLPLLLLDLYVSAQSGLLKVSREGVEKTIHIMMGKPIFASSNDPRDRMGALLHRREIITEEQLEECLGESKESGKRLGTVLVEKGYLEPEQLVAAVVDQVEEIIYSLFEWYEGKYSFEPGDPVTDEVITLDLSAASIILEGVRRKYSPERLKKVLGPSTRILRMNPNPAYQFQELHLTPEQEEILKAVDGEKTIEDVISVGEELGLPESDVSLFLCGLILTKTLETEEHAPPFSPPEKPISAQTGSAPEDIGAEILKKYKEFPGITLYEKLGLSRKATKGDVLSAYNKLLKRLKPEKLGPEYDDIREKARAVFSQIQEAYAILFRDDTRAKYDHDIEKKTGASFLDIEEAEVIEELAEEEPARARKAFERAKVLFQEKKFAEAVKAFEEAIRLDPRVSEYYTGLGLLHATDFPDHEPDMDEAEKYFMKAIALNPTEGRNYYYLGVIYKSREEWERAEKYFKKVLELIPGHPEARHQLESLPQVRA